MSVNGTVDMQVQAARRPGTLYLTFSAFYILYLGTDLLEVHYEV